MLSRALTFAAAVALAVPAFAQDRETPPETRLNPGQRQTDNPQANPRTAPPRRGDVQLSDWPEPAGNQPADGERRMAARPNAAGNAAHVSSEALARWISQDNQAEIALAEYAKQKSQNPKVREFAQKMIDAHSKFAQKLDQVGGSVDPTAPGAVNRRTSAFRGGAAPDANAANAAGEEIVVDLVEPGDPALADPVEPPARNRDRNAAAANPQERNANREGNPNRERNMERIRQARGGSAADLLAFREQLKQRCGKSLKENFDKLSPADFDKAYASQQIGAHLGMIDTLSLASEQADGQAAEVFRAGKMETQKHLIEAISLLNSVASVDRASRN